MPDVGTEINRGVKGSWFNFVGDEKSFDELKLVDVAQGVDEVCGFRTEGWAVGVIFSVDVVNVNNGGKVGGGETVETLGVWCGNNNLCKKLITVG